MITDIPSADEYRDAGINLLHLAWQIAMQTTSDFEGAEMALYGVDDETLAEATAIYWRKSQPALGNAISLVQQAMEMGLKGRIAAVSPFLLIAREPKEWPRGSDRQDTAFSSFRSLDAADLVKVHNTLAAAPLDDHFQTFWQQIRSERNTLMHSGAPKAYDPAGLIRNVLTAAEMLFDDMSWPRRLLHLEAEGRYAGLGGDYDRNVIMEQVERAIRHLSPADLKRFFKFDPKRRAYACPACWAEANRDYQDDWPRLAQPVSRAPGETKLRCAVCNEVSQIERSPCTGPDCLGNVVHENMCLTCLRSQDSPYDFQSALLLNDGQPRPQHRFEFRKGNTTTGDHAGFACDNDAIEHARLAMSAPYLTTWESVHVEGPGRQPLGHWARTQSGLEWIPVAVKQNP